MKDKKDYLQVYEDFWKDIIEKNGVVDMDQVKRELSDFEFMMDQVPGVYMAVSGGRISKPNTYAFEVISQFEELYLDKGITHDDVAMFIKESKTKKELIESLKDYFEIDY